MSAKFALCRRAEHAMHIAIIGLGEVGRAYAKALQSAGHMLQLCTALSLIHI